jgi:hypothetical protein
MEGTIGMSDIRRCDGPDCKAEVYLENKYGTMISGDPDRYLKLEDSGPRPLHFHSEACLENWVRSNASGGQ